MDAAAIVQDLERIVADIVSALSEEGAGGRKVTPEEWAELGVDLTRLAQHALSLAGPARRAAARRVSP